MTMEQKLGGLPGTEDVGPKMDASDLVVGQLLECGPPLGVEKRLVGKPVRNKLLRHRRALHDFRETFGEGGLAAPGDIDRPFEGANVLLFDGHTPAIYTNQFVAVNNPVCVTDHTGAGTVVDMEQARAKRQRNPAHSEKPKRSSERVAIPGPDGKTLGQRVNEAMAYKSGSLRTPYLQSDLIRDVARIMQISNAEATSKLQQRISAIMNNKVSESHLAGAIAASCGVNHLWLAYGAGKMYL